MKKNLSLLIVFLSCSVLFAVEKTNGTINVKIGDEIKCPVDGKIVQKGNKNLPKCYDKNTIVIEFPNTYWFENQKIETTYQLIISGVKFTKEIKAAPVDSVIKYGDLIGTATKSPGLINIRSKDFDMFLTDVTDVCPEFEGDWYYFGIRTILSSTPKFLNYMPAESRKTVIEFPDYPESIGDLMDNVVKSYTENEKSGLNISNFPEIKICIKTKLSEYPKQKTQKSVTEGLYQMKMFPNCPFVLSIKFDGVPMRLFFQQGFDKYLEEEYKLGKPIYLYLYTGSIINGEYWCYVRDFSLKSPDDIAKEKMQKVKSDFDEKNQKE